MPQSFAKSAEQKKPKTRNLGLAFAEQKMWQSFAKNVEQKK